MPRKLPAAQLSGLFLRRSTKCESGSARARRERVETDEHEGKQRGICIFGLTEGPNDNTQITRQLSTYNPRVLLGFRPAGKLPASYRPSGVHDLLVFARYKP